MAPSKSTYFLCGQIFSTLYCTHNKQYSGNCSLPLWNLAKLATRNGWILEVDFLFSRIKDFPRPMSNISYFRNVGLLSLRQRKHVSLLVFLKSGHLTAMHYDFPCYLVRVCAVVP